MPRLANEDQMDEAEEQVWEASHNMGQNGMRYEQKSFKVRVGAPGNTRWTVDFTKSDGTTGSMVVFLDTPEAAAAHVESQYGHSVCEVRPYKWGKSLREEETIEAPAGD